MDGPYANPIFLRSTSPIEAGFAVLQPLRTTSLSCEAISAACGVCDANHLAHLFRRKFGASPSSFRAKAGS